jgi:hypothetical protein
MFQEIQDKFSKTFRNLRSFNTESRDEYEVLNNIVQDMCGGLRHISFGNKLRALRPGNRSFYQGEVLWNSSLEAGWAHSHNGVKEGQRNSL